MYLNFLDLVHIEAGNTSNHIVEFLKHEYGLFEDQGPSAEANITIEFVDDVLDIDRSVQVRAPVGYDDRGVLLYDTNNHVARIDFEAIGYSPCRVTCDSNFNPYFFSIIIEYLVHFNMLLKNAVFCHCSAFEMDGRVVLCPAWRNVGKTNVLLAALLAGAQYISDDWGALFRDGTIRSLPKRLNLLYYNFDAYPELLKQSPPKHEALVDFIRRAKKGDYGLDDDTISRLSAQARMRVSPYDAFNQSYDTKPFPIDYVFHLCRRSNVDGPARIAELECGALVHILNSILEFEQSYFHLAYLVHKAQTGMVNPFLEQAKTTSLQIMLDTFKQVAHIYQISISSQHQSQETYRLIMSKIHSDK